MLLRSILTETRGRNLGRALSKRRKKGWCARLLSTLLDGRGNEHDQMNKLHYMHRIGGECGLVSKARITGHD